MRFTFRLKSLFVLLLLFSFLLATIAYQVKKRQEFFYWKDFLERQYADIDLEDQYDVTQDSNWSLPHVTSIKLNDWTVKNEDSWIEGISCLGRVDKIAVLRGEFGMSSLRKFERVSAPDWLALYNVEPDALVGLPDSFRSITCLDFVEPKPGAVELDRIGQLQALEELSLDEIRLSTECKWLQNLQELRSLTVIGSTGVSHLIPFLRSSDLTELIAFYSDLSDSDAEAIANLPRLRFVSLKKTEITDQGIRHFEGHSHIQRFFCSGTSVSDESLAIFASMPSLEELRLMKTKVTQEGIERFKASRPEVLVESDY